MGKELLYLFDGFFSEWENEVLEIIEEQLEVCRSDAQGIAEVKEEELINIYEQRLEPITAFNVLFKNPI
jgi:hypothetical protein